MKLLFTYRGYGNDGSNSVIDFQRYALLQQSIEVGNFKIGTEIYFDEVRIVLREELTQEENRKFKYIKNMIRNQEI